MKKLLFLFLLALPAFGQGVRFDGVVLLDTGRPANTATVRVCSAGSSGTPCTPTASVFTDKTLGSALGNPFTTDTRGNFNFYAACNSYDIQYSGSGLTTLTMKDVQIGPCGNFAIRGGMKTLTFSATPVFDASLSSSFRIVLTANVTSSTLTNAANALPLNIEVCQDGTGGRTFVPPANVVGWVPISATASACTMEEFVYDGTNAVNPIAAQQTVTAVNGVSFPSSPSTHSVPVTTAANTETYKVIPDCTDTTGNHINYTQSTDVFSCGTSVPASTVTLTGAQAPTNKTLTGVSTGNTVTLMSSGCTTQGNTGSITGTGAAANIYTCSLPASTIATNKVLQVSCSGFHDTGTANPSVTVSLNGVNVLTGSIGTTASQSFSFMARVLNTGATTGEAWGIVTVNGATNPFSVSLTGLAWTSAQTLNCQFNVASTDHITGRSWIPESLQ